MAVNRGDILRRKGRGGRWMVVRKVRVAYSDAAYSWVIMLKVRAHDGVSYGRDVVAIIENSRDDIPAGYIRPDAIPPALEAWRTD